MVCKECGCSIFFGHQVCRLDILVSGLTGDFYDNMPGGISIYDSGNPYGPFQCTGCGSVYEELKGDAAPRSGPIEGWNFNEKK